MRAAFGVPLAFALSTFIAQQACGHGTPINAYVQAASGQLAVFDGYEPGELESSFGSDVFTDAPGIGVSSPVNGIAAGEQLSLNVLQGLLFWDGRAVTATEETLSIDRPLGGSSAVDYYEVTAESGYQTGMLWGTYQPAGGTGSWDAHGDYGLYSFNPQPGVYGVVLQLASPSYVASEPFLVPLVYDPLATFGANDIADGIAALRSAVLPLPTADFDRSTLVDQLDFDVWQFGYATSQASLVQGDATQDGRVAGNDFLAWQSQYTRVDAPAVVVTLPEPHSWALAVYTVAMAVHVSCRCSRKIRIEHY